MKAASLHGCLQTAFRWGALLTLCAAPTQWTLIDTPRLGPADLLLAATAGVWGLDILLTRGWSRLWAARPQGTHLLFTVCVGAAACVAVEDTADGIASARGAGIPVVAVATNLPADWLRAAGAAAVVESLAGLTPARLAALAGLARTPGFT